MSRPLRCREPGVYHFSTMRCLESRFFLRPDPALNALFGYWLARSLRAFPEITLHGAVAMPDHIHLLTRDDGGVLSSFASYFFGNLSKAVNKLRRRSGPLFQRRFDDGGRVLDAQAAVQRLVCLVLNPVKVGLVARHSRWPGVLLWANSAAQTRHFVWSDNDALQAARRASPGGRIDPELFNRRESLTVYPLPFSVSPERVTLIGNHELLAIDGAAKCVVDAFPAAEPASGALLGATQAALHLVRELERREGERRRVEGLSFMGGARVVAQDPETRPDPSATSPRALCHATDVGLWLAFRRAMTAFTSAYRRAAKLFRRRDPKAEFPAFSMLPGGAPAA
jgi:REP element-mobilizing transposase RayT